MEYLYRYFNKAFPSRTKILLQLFAIAILQIKSCKFIFCNYYLDI